MIEKKEISQGNDKPKEMALNLAHVLFIHGTLRNLSDNVDFTNEPEMERFVSELLIILEINIDSVKLDEALMKKFNYSPLKIRNDEKKK